MTPLQKALRNEAKIKELTDPEEHPHGISEESYSDGSKRFSGPGGGVLWILSTGAASISREGEIRSEAMERLLAAQFPPRPIEFSDLHNYKEESRLLLEALRTAKAQFFRNIGDAIKPTKSILSKRQEDAKNTGIKESEVSTSIEKAASVAGGIPPLKLVLTHYRAVMNRPLAPAQELKRKLEGFGFGWLSI